MTKLSRQTFLQTTGLLATTSGLSAIEPFQRVAPRIKGLSLATYSLRQQMNTFKGKATKGKMNMFDFLEFAAKCQFDAVECTAYFFEDPVTPSYLNRLKRGAHLLGLDMSSGAIGNNMSYDPMSEEGKAQAKYVSKWIDHYADLGVPVIRIFAGKKGPKGASEEKILNHVKNNLYKALEHAEKRGVMLGMENHDSMTRVDKLVRFVKDIQSDYYGITWDSANITTEGDPYLELEKIAPYCINAQVKVKIPHQGKKVDTDFQKIVDILNRANYGGYLVLEYEEPEDPFQKIPHFKNELQKLI